ncbi:tyrosine-type recombinase/integrase [Corynebacterium amycolatum]|uniref:tyrosine-type recombinase/integrase n=1 Tax=Corynebacterium amycolatum TaxID=43765 RepID=UPI001EF519DB|nr:tyrosine-type recombinase/integrase [Corynebacterium amycolatum]MCG7269538.1 tyrosine-type recombinase/integrase [Corynebacterium amycolatum]
MAFGSIRKLKSGRFQARYTYRGQDCKAPDTFKTRSLAQGWLNEEEKLISFNEWTHPEQRAAEEQLAQQRHALTVEAWLDQYHDGLTVRASTLQTYRRTVRNRITAPLPPGDADPDITRLAGIPLVELSKADIYGWWDAITRAYDTPETNQKAYVRLKAACDEAVRRELIDRNPVEIAAAKRRSTRELPYLPTTEELHAVVDEMRPSYKLLTVLCLFHGLRIGEAIALEVDDVICEVPVPYAPRYSIRVKQNAQRITPDDGPTFMLLQRTKSQAGNREVPFMPSMVPLLWEHMAKHVAPEPVELNQAADLGGGTRPARLLTTTIKGEVVFDTSYRAVLERAVKRAGVSERIKPHSGRRWLVTRLAEEGAHVKEIGRILGDDDLSVIMGIYMQVRAERTTELMGIVDASVTAAQPKEQG